MKSILWEGSAADFRETLLVGHAVREGRKRMSMEQKLWVVAVVTASDHATALHAGVVMACDRDEAIALGLHEAWLARVDHQVPCTVVMTYAALVERAPFTDQQWQELVASAEAYR